LYTKDVRFSRIAAALVALLLVIACSARNAAPDFTLVDEHGAAWSLGAQHGKTIALFFGYTHCTDVCPETLAMLARAVNGLGAGASHTEIVFITVDPQRDTPPVLARYVSRFDAPSIVGLTGTPAELKPVYSAYRVWAQRIPGGTKTGYEMAHSSTVYIIGPDGTLRSIHDWQDSLQAFTTALREASS
jgi:protein SCO1